MAIINFDDTTPAPPAGKTNVKWQGDSSSPRNVSAYMPLLVGDSGSGGASGAVPAPAAGDAAAGKFLKADGTFALPSASPGGTPVREVPAGTLNGSNMNFTLSFTPNPTASLTLWKNGVEQDPTRWYTLSGNTITFTVAPLATDKHVAQYTH